MGLCTFRFPRWSWTWSFPTAHGSMLLSLRQILGWLKPPMRTGACDCEATAICLSRAPSTPSPWMGVCSRIIMLATIALPVLSVSSSSTPSETPSGHWCRWKHFLLVSFPKEPISLHSNTPVTGVILPCPCHANKIPALHNWIVSAFNFFFVYCFVCLPCFILGCFLFFRMVSQLDQE